MGSSARRPTAVRRQGSISDRPPRSYPWGRHDLFDYDRINEDPALDLPADDPRHHLASPEAKDWSPSAYSPRTGLLYIPHNNLAMDHGGVEANYIAGTPYLGTNLRMYAGSSDGHRGELTA